MNFFARSLILQLSKTMKTFKPIALILAAVALFCAAPRASARTSVSFDFFYDNLDPYGEWVEVPDYGYCWHPTGVDTEWAPYTDGYWAYTDGGWTWVSYEDFGGITYHYGRWVRLEDEGWCWVPDYEWAPAWVSWRVSDDYIGWAPLPPRAHFRHEIGISIWADAEYDIGPTNYSFCEFRHFGDPALRPVIIDRSRNVTIINRTTNITNITVNRTTNNIYVGGPQYQTVAARTTRPVQVLKLKRETDVAAVRVAGGKTLARQQGNQLVVLAPDVSKTEKAKPQKVAKTIAAPKVDTGWNGVSDPQVKQQLQTKMKGEGKGVKPEKAPAKPVNPEDLKIVQEKTKSSPEAAAGASSPVATPSENLAKGKGKKGTQQPQTLTAEPRVAPATSPAVTAKSKKGKAENLAPNQSGITAAATPFEKAKGKNKKAAQEMTTQSVTPAATGEQAPVKKSARGETTLQPFMAQPDQTTTQPLEKKGKQREMGAVDQTAREQQRAAAEAARAQHSQQRELNADRTAQERVQQQQLNRDRAVEMQRAQEQRHQLQAQPQVQHIPQAGAPVKEKGEKGKKKTKEELEQEQLAR